MSAPTSVFTDFSKDGVYSPFLRDDFDVQQHTTELVQGVVIAEHLNKLSLGLSRVESELEQHVGEHYEELLAQAAGIDTLENSLAAIQARTQTLQAGVERVRARIVEPYYRLEKHTLMLARLQSSCELLRRLIRCLAVTSRLTAQLNNCPNELAKAATSISELEELYSDGELCGISVLEGSERLASTARDTVQQQATDMLHSGAITHNQTQVGTALQVFHNLGCLGTSVSGVVTELLQRLNNTIATSLDATAIADAASNAANTKKGMAPGKSVLPALGQTTQFRAALWASLEKLMDDIHNTVLMTHHLHKVLVKKRDPVSHVVFLDAVEQHCGRDLFSKVWMNITAELTKHFAIAATGSHFIRQALEVDYPKLVRLYGELWRRLETGASDMMLTTRPAAAAADTTTASAAAATAASTATDIEPERMLRASLQPLEAAFLSRSLSRLFDPVNLMFSSPTTPPTKQECDALIKTISSEVNVSSVDGVLSENVARNVLKAVQLLCSKCEQMMPVDRDATQVIGPSTEQQQLVVSTVNQLLYLRGQLDRALSASLSHLCLTPAALNTLKATVPALDAVMTAGVAPLFASISTAIQDILLTMHNEDFSSNESGASSSNLPCSLYLRELQTFLTRAATDYIAPFHSSNILRQHTDEASTRCLTLFVWHASLLRPVGDGGKLRLAADFAQLEEGISALCSKPSDLGQAYRLLRAVRPLLFLTPQHMIQVSSVGDLLPYSLILHLLFARAPPELRSPHQSANWSIGQYLSWLEQHPQESERLELIAGTLESYVTTVRRTGRTHYAPVYPVMVQALEEGMRRHGGVK
uniref:Conserved oligomeric Golgi complex subunit 5 n=1 Tax=Hirondellea gigas TaxID=1518452 RepID=A0A2P2I785_9CRUS